MTDRVYVNNIFILPSLLFHSPGAKTNVIILLGFCYNQIHVNVHVCKRQFKRITETIIFFFP